jgi:hypothetical protein
MFTAGLVAFVLGMCLAQLNVLSVAIATVATAAVPFMIAITIGWTIFDSFLVSIIAVLALQGGYLGGHLLRILQK